MTEFEYSDSKGLTQPAYFEVRELTQFEYSDSKGLTQHEHYDGKENLRRKIPTRQQLKERVFNLRHNLPIFGVSPFVKRQNKSTTVKW